MKFKPEFLNRVDEIVLFKPLMKDEIIKIIGLLINQLQERLNDRNIKLKVNNKAIQLIADEAYSPIYGARPIKRYLQKNIETQIAKMIISGTLQENSIAVVDEVDGEIVVTAMKQEEVLV